MLLLHKQPHDKRSITESLQAYITRARLSVKWVYFQEKYYNSQNYAYPPPFEKPLKFIVHGRIFKRLQCYDNISVKEFVQISRTGYTLVYVCFILYVKL